MARWLARLKEAEEGGKKLESDDPRIVAAEIVDALNLRKEVSWHIDLYRLIGRMGNRRWGYWDFGHY